jgi:hypothetical protein
VVADGVPVEGAAKLGVAGVIADLPRVVLAGSELGAGVVANNAAVSNACIGVVRIDGATGTIADVPTITAAGGVAIAGVVTKLPAVHRAGFRVVARVVANGASIKGAGFLPDVAGEVTDLSLVAIARVGSAARSTPNLASIACAYRYCRATKELIARIITDEASVIRAGSLAETRIVANITTGIEASLNPVA